MRGLSPPVADQHAATRSLVYGFVVVPNFSLIALSACLDPLRIANHVLGETAFRTVPGSGVTDQGSGLALRHPPCHCGLSRSVAAANIRAMRWIDYERR
jgi:hypothetical protein